MKGFKRAVGLGLLVGGALGGWGCGRETPPADTQGFQDPVQLQHRPREDVAGRAAGSDVGQTSSEQASGNPYNSERQGSPGGNSALGTGLAESYRGGAASEGTGGSGRDAGTGGSGGRDAGTMDAGTHHQAQPR